MTTLEATLTWLESRLAAAPPELAADVRILVREAEGDGLDESGDAIAALLAHAALDGLAEVVEGLGRRDSALRLLSADAALTFAFEAAADLGGDVRTLCHNLGPRGEFGRRLSGFALHGARP
jgi:hypothetical protein